MVLDRRSFLVTSATAGVALGFPHIVFGSQRSRATLVIKNGLVYDGLGRMPIEADVAIEGDRIVAVGPNLPVTGVEVLDARGLAVAPGFIDIHSHSDLTLLVNPNAESKVRQGVTTEVVGQDGDSIGPWSDGTFESIRDRYKDVYGVIIDFRHLPEFFGRLEIEAASVNLASMIGAGTVREFVVGGEDRAATPDELRQMVDLVRAYLRSGACGLSTGLEYLPGAFADTKELIELCRPLAGTGLPYASHMRNEDDRLFGAIEEALQIGSAAGVPTHISHLKASGRPNWWKADTCLEMIEEAIRNGARVTFDRYPYVAYSTGLASMFPVWSREGGASDFIERLENDELAPAIREAVDAKVARLGDWNSVQITAARSDSLSWANGRKIGELAAERGVDPYELVRHITIADRNGTGMVGYGMSERNTSTFLAHPRGMICSDAGARAPYGALAIGSPHPRAYGSFPRVLGHYCRERGLMPLETAIQKMTSMPADLIGMSDRGRIAADMAADLVVFDPETVNDHATFEKPHQYPEGIEYVFVNGQAVIARGEHTDATPGRVLKPATSLSSQ